MHLHHVGGPQTAPAATYGHDEKCVTDTSSGLATDVVTRSASMRPSAFLVATWAHNVHLARRLG